MADPIKFETLDGIPEPLHPHFKAVEGEGYLFHPQGFVAATVHERIKTDSAARKTKIDKVLAKIRAAEIEADDPEAGIDEIFSRHQAVLAEIEGKKAGLSDEEISKLLEERFGRREKDYLAKLEKLGKDLDTTKTGAAQRSAKIEGALRRQAIRLAGDGIIVPEATGEIAAAAARAGLRPDWDSEIDEEEDPPLYFFGSDGEIQQGANGPLTVAEWLQERRAKKPHQYIPLADGGGSQGGAAASGKKISGRAPDIASAAKSSIADYRAAREKLLGKGKR